ncbi:MAG: hypothetical protein K2F84_06170 [Bacteroidales bacterium]|nr:hypothetical protein [Bacteroidales bacterium]
MGLIAIGPVSAQATDNTLPQNAKFKTVNFKQYNYAIQGYVAKKAFVEGQKIVILSPISGKNIHPDTLLFGEYFTQNDTAYIAAPSAEIQLHNLIGFSDITGISDCIYKISNHTDGMSLTANPSMATPFTMELYDLKYLSYKHLKLTPTRRV